MTRWRRGNVGVCFKPNAIKGMTCKLIINDGSFTNVVSKDLVYALGLSISRHLEPYYMEWLDNAGKLKITHKVHISFPVGDYVDQVECDVLPLEVCCLLLGSPWQYDHDATHAGRINTYTSCMTTSGMCSSQRWRVRLNWKSCLLQGVQDHPKSKNGFASGGG